MRHVASLEIINGVGSWRQIVQLTIANIVSCDHCINTELTMLAEWINIVSTVWTLSLFYRSSCNAHGRRREEWKSQSEWQRTEVSGDSTSMVRPSLGLRTAVYRPVVQHCSQLRSWWVSRHIWHRQWHEPRYAAASRPSVYTCIPHIHPPPPSLLNILPSITRLS